MSQGVAHGHGRARGLAVADEGLVTTLRSTRVQVAVVVEPASRLGGPCVGVPRHRVARGKRTNRLASADVGCDADHARTRGAGRGDRELGAAAERRGIVQRQRVRSGVERGPRVDPAAARQTEQLEVRFIAARGDVVVMELQRCLAEIEGATDIVGGGPGALEIPQAHGVGQAGCQRGIDNCSVETAVTGARHVRQPHAVHEVRRTGVGIGTPGDGVAALELQGLELEDAARLGIPAGLRVVGLLDTLIDGEAAEIDVHQAAVGEHAAVHVEIVAAVVRHGGTTAALQQGRSAPAVPQVGLVPEAQVSTIGERDRGGVLVVVVAVVAGEITPPDGVYSDAVERQGAGGTPTTPTHVDVAPRLNDRAGRRARRGRERQRHFVAIVVGDVQTAAVRDAAIGGRLRQVHVVRQRATGRTLTGDPQVAADVELRGAVDRDVGPGSHGLVVVLVESVAELSFAKDVQPRPVREADRGDGGDHLAVLVLASGSAQVGIAAERQRPAVQCQAGPVPPIAGGDVQIAARNQRSRPGGERKVHVVTRIPITPDRETVAERHTTHRRGTQRQAVAAGGGRWIVGIAATDGKVVANIQMRGRIDGKRGTINPEIPCLQRRPIAHVERRSSRPDDAAVLVTNLRVPIKFQRGPILDVDDGLTGPVPLAHTPTRPAVVVGAAAELHGPGTAQREHALRAVRRNREIARELHRRGAAGTHGQGDVVVVITGDPQAVAEGHETVARRRGERQVVRHLLAVRRQVAATTQVQVAGDVQLRCRINRDVGLGRVRPRPIPIIIALIAADLQVATEVQSGAIGEVQRGLRCRDRRSRI